MEKRIPKTKEEGFAQLDAMLSDEEKKELMNCEDTFVYHFTLGMWIRNNWLYPLNVTRPMAFSHSIPTVCRLSSLIAIKNT